MLLTLADRADGAFTAAYARHMALYTDICQYVRQCPINNVLPLVVLEIILGYFAGSKRDFTFAVFAPTKTIRNRYAWNITADGNSLYIEEPITRHTGGESMMRKVVWVEDLDHIPIFVRDEYCLGSGDNYYIIPILHAIIAMRVRRYSVGEK
jgi:hypothetical protein